MDKIWDGKSVEVGGHWPLWWRWKKRMTTQNRQKSNAKKEKEKKEYIEFTGFNLFVVLVFTLGVNRVNLQCYKLGFFWEVFVKLCLNTLTVNVCISQLVMYVCDFGWWPLANYVVNMWVWVWVLTDITDV